MAEKHKFGITPKNLKALESGDTNTLIMILTCFAKSWVEISGYSAQTWESISLTNAAASSNSTLIKTTPEQRAFLAAGCDLFALLSLTPQGREALSHLFSQPFTQQAKCK